MTDGCDELNVARKNLVDTLGGKSKLYFSNMKLWFQMKSTKEDFDYESRKMMTPDQIHLHNKFLLCLFNKCHSLVSSHPTSSSKKAKSFVAVKSNLLHDENKKNKMKRKNHSDKANFEAADVYDYVTTLHPLPPNALYEPLRYSCQEFFLPDKSLIYGRLLLSAWELDLKGADELAAELLVTAVQHFLKNVVTAILSRRKGYKVREGRFLYAMGSRVPNPWLRNTANITKGVADSCAMDNNDEDEEETKETSNTKVTLEEMEQRAAYELACSNLSVTSKMPTSPYQVLEAMQVHRNVIPSHTVYTKIVERIIAKLSHPTHQEIETGS